MSEPEFLTSTRATYETVARAYTEASREGLRERPFDRAFLTLFAELVREAGGTPGGRVADVGCGPGHVTRFLRDLGLHAFGLDLSPAMLGRARETYPDLEFREASVLDLGVTDQSLDGIVALFSFNTVPPEHLSVMLNGFRRALRPGGLVLLAFSVRETPLGMTSWLDHEVDLPLQRLVPDEVARALTDAGLPVVSQTVRAPRPPHETRPYAHLLASRPTVF
ncbi:methyltransferase domain-containing protein [Kineosporia sp. J2-2]|uniref:Methyltransferase domain-containing protein n=1 Tax=Kineosporia corallincola TaxID=2835133 RepID=A0ABS5TEC3_9ACTN|nr:class I SAM-dependent methyltransferase [Kineosporia corallincola]MBT0769429.1 methyltransferase domain-containing protein [Kineosporia corallincola]